MISKTYQITMYLQVMFKTLDPQWLEQFNLHMYADQPKILEISVYDKDFHGKDDFMGRYTFSFNVIFKFFQYV